MHFVHPVTPAEVGPVLRVLIDELVPGGHPAYVDVRTIDGAAKNECFAVVEGMVRAHGGELVVGWSLWELPTLFVEAEFHGVWRTADDELVDPTPKAHPTQRVLFLSDVQRSYTGEQVNNSRRAIREGPLLQDYFATFNATYELMNRGERVSQHGEVTLKGSEIDELDRIQSEQERLHFQLLPLLPLVGPYHPCPCGSGKKVRWCHREYLS